jgi:hypothetical protein
MHELVTNIVKNIKFLAANESVQPRGSAFFFQWSLAAEQCTPPYSVFFFFFWFAAAFLSFIQHKGKILKIFFLA